MLPCCHACQGGMNVLFMAYVVHIQQQSTFCMYGVYSSYIFFLSTEYSVTVYKHRTTESEE